MDNPPTLPFRRFPSLIKKSFPVYFVHKSLPVNVMPVFAAHGLCQGSGWYTAKKTGIQIEAP